MLQCKKCFKSFNGKANIDGKMRNLYGRQYCLNCSPFGGRNTRKLHEVVKTEKFCSKCNTIKPATDFTPRKSRRGDDSGFLTYCKKCKNSIEMEKRLAIKIKCIDYKGGKCSLCGYFKYTGALEFHHTEPEHKDFNISEVIRHVWSNKIEEELNKCILVCSNCHREEHSKLKKVKKDRKISKCQCGQVKKASSENCRSCARKKSQGLKIEWPKPEDIIREIKETSYSSVAKRLGVTDSSIRKYLYRNGIELP